MQEKRLEIMQSVAIHQPTMLPWLGFFSKMCRADIFVVLDHTLNNPRDSRLLLRRTRMVIDRRAGWISLPIDKQIAKGRTSIPIAEFEYSPQEERAKEKLLTRMRSSYSKCTYFGIVWPLVESFICSNENSLARRNVDGIESILNYLGIEVEMVLSSSMGIDKKARKDEMIIEILKKLKAEVYWHGAGALQYQKPELYRNEGIELRLNRFDAIPYAQRSSSFIGGASIIDAMMNMSKEEVVELVKGKF